MKHVPMIVTLVPTIPLAGVKLVIVGGDSTVKALELVAVPPGVVTLIDPVVAFFDSYGDHRDLHSSPSRRSSDLNRTAVAPLKFVPLIVTLVPTSPLVGVKLVIVGGVDTVNAPELDDHPRVAGSRAAPIKACAPTVAGITAHETED